jgi:hypothetical protein
LNSSMDVSSLHTASLWPTLRRNLDLPSTSSLGYALRLLRGLQSASVRGRLGWWHLRRLGLCWDWRRRRRRGPGWWVGLCGKGTFRRRWWCRFDACCRDGSCRCRFRCQP